MADDIVFLPVNRQGLIAGRAIEGWQVILRPPLDNRWRELVKPEFTAIESLTPPLGARDPILFRQKGVYKNPATGQVFMPVVSGQTAEAVEIYSAGLRMACLVLPAAPAGTPPAVWPPLTTRPSAASPIGARKGKYGHPPADRHPALDVYGRPPADRHPELDVIVNILPIDVGGVQPPYRMIFAIDPDVKAGAAHSYPFSPRAGWGLGVTTWANNGWVKTTFYHNGAGSGGLEVDTFADTATPQSAFQGVFGSDTLCVEVLGLWADQISTYTLTGEVTTDAITTPSERRCSAVGQ